MLDVNLRVSGGALRVGLWVEVEVPVRHVSATVCRELCRLTVDWALAAGFLLGHQRGHQIAVVVAAGCSLGRQRGFQIVVGAAAVSHQAQIALQTVAAVAVGLCPASRKAHQTAAESAARPYCQTVRQIAAAAVAVLLCCQRVLLKAAGRKGLQMAAMVLGRSQRGLRWVLLTKRAV